MDELDQSPVLTEDPDGRVPRTSDFPRRFGRRCEQLGEIGGSGDGGSTCNECCQPLRGYFRQTRKNSE